MKFQISRTLLQTVRNVLPNASRGFTSVSDQTKSYMSPQRLDESVKQVGSIQRSTFPSIDIPRTDFISFLFRDANKWGHKVFQECGITGRKYTYGETWDGLLRWGAGLKKLLPKARSPTMATLCTNSPENALMLFGTFAAGGIGTPINPTHTPGEIAFQLRDSGADILVVDSFLEPLAEQALKHLGKDIPVILNGPPTQSGRPLAQDIFLDPKAPKLQSMDVDPKSVCLLLYSSGTTGKPKGAMITHQGLVSNVLLYSNEEIIGSRPAIGDHQDVQMGILPQFHVSGFLGTTINGAHHGVKIITLPKFDPLTFISTLKNHKMTLLQAVPSLVKFIAECPSVTNEDLELIRTMVVGAAPVPEDLVRATKKKMPLTLFQEVYGMTEILLSHVTPQNEERTGYCGKLLPNLQAKIVDTQTGDILPPYVAGEMIIKSPSMMAGYINNKEQTEAMIDEEGWLRTGDIAMHTEDGFFSIVDRVKDLIKVKGFQVAPVEVEETIELHPGVQEAGVVGVPHPRYGEAPLAYVVKRDPSLTEEEVHAHLQSYLSQHKQLSGGIKFVSELPKNQVGKILRKSLREMARAS